MSTLHTEPKRKNHICEERGSELPARTCRWLKVNDVATELERYPGFMPFDGLTVSGVEGDVEEKGQAEHNSIKYGIITPKQANKSIKYGTKEAKEPPNSIKYGISKTAEILNRQDSNVLRDWSMTDGAEETLYFMVSEKNPSLQDRLTVHVPCGHCATLILHVESDETAKGSRNGVLHIEVEEDADLKLVLFNRLNKDCISNQSVSFTVADGGNLRIAHVEMGGARTNYHLSGDLEGVEAKMEEYVAYLAQEKEALDLFYHVRFHGLYTEGIIRADGALFDEAYKSFRGTLDFLEGARGAVGDEEEVTVLMSEKARSVAVPILLCHEDAVQGNHATSAGRVDEEMLFYLMSRGLSRQEAEGMIVESRMAQTLDRIPNVALRESIHQAIHDRLTKRKR